MRWWSNKIRLLRLEQKLTLKEASEESGISSAYLSALENDRRVPAIKTLEKIFNVYGHDMASAAGVDIADKALAWQKKNLWYGAPTHMGKTVYALELHQYLISEEVDVDSDAYYKELDGMISQWDRPSLRKECPICGETFLTKPSNKEVCSETCRKRKQRALAKIKEKEE